MGEALNTHAQAQNPSLDSSSSDSLPYFFVPFCSKFLKMIDYTLSAVLLFPTLSPSPVCLLSLSILQTVLLWITTDFDIWHCFIPGSIFRLHLDLQATFARSIRDHSFALMHFLSLASEILDSLGFPPASVVTLLVSSDCYNEAPWTEWLRPQALWTSGSWEVQGHDARRFSSWWSRFSWLADSLYCVPTWPFLGACVWRESLLFPRARITLWGLTLMTWSEPSTSQRAHLQIPSCWKLSLQHIIFFFFFVFLGPYLWHIEVLRLA